MNVNNTLVIALAALRLNLTHYYLLLLAEKGEYIALDEACDQTLRRKLYIVDGSLSTLGQELLSSLHANSSANIKEKIKARKRDKGDSLERWWKAYPATTTWEDDRGVLWEGGRSLRIKKDKCFEKIENEWLAKGADIDVMIELVQWDFEKLKAKSIATQVNETKWMPSTERWLNTRNYQDAVEAMRIEKKKSTISRNTPVDTTNLF